MTSVFLSYARGDDVEPFDPATSFVTRLYRDLKAAGFHVWFDREGRRIVSGAADNTVRVWDVQGGACLEVIEGTGDVTTIAAAGTALLWRAVVREQETLIEPTAGGAQIAWFPAAMW